MDKLKLLSSFVHKQQTTLGFGLVALLTAGGEQIFSAVVFKCPCNYWNLAYGSVFLFVPALVLFALGCVLNNKIWRLFTGLCKDSQQKFHLAKFQVFLPISISAAVAPVSWIAVALLSGVYFECILTGVNTTFLRERLCSGKTKACLEEVNLFPCGKGSVPADERDDVLMGLRALSQILGWLLIAAVTVFGLLFTCVAKCRSPVSYLQLKFWQEYTKKESSLLEKHMGQNAECLAERNLKSFFQQTPPEPVLTPANKAWQKISSLYSFSTEHQYYSLLQKYVETALDDNNGMSEMSDPGEPAPTVLSFVDEGKTTF
ncbi:calcium homeostasis modulator protein 5-like [Paramormyrops kingsleyae]|uniref:Calcium homeostasis modulator family member 6 n=1 Tax=Paramormyrops kingsleyae TaxID=1676925 RepID=A0A3B3QZN9_9TELE|nr:calcium homeostasis modulator protein 5-like [Paramormyrops kingsleyae]